MAETKIRAVIVAPILNPHDAISRAAIDTRRIIESLPSWECRLLTTHNDCPEVDAESVAGVADLLCSPAFLAADLIFYHYGIYHPLFDALLFGNGHAKQVVKFHNVTPAAYLRAEDGPLIERSLRQLHNFAHADAVWADSDTNARALCEQGVALRQLDVVPLLVEAPTRHILCEKRADKVEILFIGRFVRSKGVTDLLEALRRFRAEGTTPFHLRLVGNLDFSHADYMADVKRLAATLDGVVEFLGMVDDAARDHLLQESHILAIPSYHEGFCKPVVEGLRAGCVPVGYDMYNLPSIAAGLGRLAPAGDVDALSAVLGEAIADLAAVVHGDMAATLRLDRGLTTVAEFDARARAHTVSFEFAAIRSLFDEKLRGLFSSRSGNLRRTDKARTIFSVRADDEMREAPRHSLNRLPDLADWEAGGRLSDIMRELRQPVTIHRRSWKYALCIHGLESLGVVAPAAAGLAVGAGSEAPLYHYANTISRMVATDLYDNPEHEGSPVMLTEPERFAPFPYRREALEVLRMPGDRLDFPDASFDFVSCLSSIEHFGSRETQRRALDEMARVLKPGGVSCIITELILTEHTDREFFTWEELEAMFLRHPHLRLEGGEPDLAISESLVAFPVDLANSRHVNRSPHIVLRRGPMLWTSFSMFLRRVRV